MIRLAWLLLRREWHAGALGLIALASVIGVAAVTAVALVGDRVARGLEAQAAALLGADRVLESDRPLSVAFQDAARDAGLELARAVDFPSMVLAGGRAHLAWIQAVDEAYPLRGTVRVAQTVADEGTARAHGPPPGSVWLEPRLALALGVSVGEQVQVGRSTLRVDGFARLQPLGGALAGGVAPRLLMSLGDLPATGLVTPASRVTHRLLVAGPPAAVAAVTRRWQADLEPGMQILGPRNAGPALTTALDRGTRFLALAALAAVLLGGLAMALAARRYAEEHRRQAALLRCFGAARAQVAGVFTLQLLLFGLVAGVLGLLLGWGVQALLLRLLDALLGMHLPLPGAAPWLLGLGMGLLGLAAFALPPLWALGRVPVTTVLRPVPVRPRGRWLGLFAALAGAVLGAWALLAGWGPLALAGLAGVALALAGATRLLLYLLGRLPARGVWRVGLAGITRRPGITVVQVSGLALGLLAVLTLAWLRGDLLAQWARSLPPDAPDHFFLNLTPEQRVPLSDDLRALGVSAPTFHPMIRGRPVAVNGEPLRAEGGGGRAAHLRRREANLTYLEHLPEDNRIVSGAWSPTVPGWSLEAGYARVLGATVGDALTFDIAGEPVTAPVTSLREVAWETLRPNFFVIASPALLERFPSTWMGAARLTPEARRALPELVRRYPNLTVIDVSALLTQVRAVMDRVGQAVQLVFTLTLGAALVVMAAAWRFHRQQRRRDQALLRVLGAQDAALRRGLWREVGVVGTLAGGLALTAGLALDGWVRTALGLAQTGPWWGWPLGAAAGGLVVALAGWSFARGDLARRPWRDLTGE